MSDEVSLYPIKTIKGNFLLSMDKKTNITALQFPKSKGKNKTLISISDKQKQQLEKIQNILNDYFSGKGLSSLRLSPKGTLFQKKVWNTLRAIPFGETRSYVWVAREIGSPKGARAVGTACGKNPIPILIPCHRVVPANGGMGGFSSPLSWKRYLLKLEASNSL